MERKKEKNVNDKARKVSHTAGNNKVNEAQKQADRDIEQDPDLRPKPNLADEMDEGEMARLEGED
jgi:hypothetical protein